MQFSYRTRQYLESLQSVLLKTGFEVVDVDYYSETFCVNKVDYWKKRNGKIVKVFHHFTKWYKLPPEMIKWRKVTKNGISTSWVWQDDPYYTYTVNQKYITRGDARKLMDMLKHLPEVKRK
jgi:hypothetical protein